jgi:hypothetical protein
MRRGGLIIALIAAVAWPSMVLAQSPAPAAKRELSLTHAQRSEIWRALGKEAAKAQEPAGLSVGETIPDSMNVLPFSHHLRHKIRVIGHYRYSLMHGEVLIVDPETKKIISVVGK